jgi:hypothetical protein
MISEKSPTNPESYMRFRDTCGFCGKDPIVIPRYHLCLISEFYIYFSRIVYRGICAKFIALSNEIIYSHASVCL